MLLTLTPTHWQDYELIDTGHFERLERFGDYILRRPEPQAVWDRALDREDWELKANVKFLQKGSSSGTWVQGKSAMPDKWQIHYRNGGLQLTFKLALTRFKHVGIFPEQAANWDFIYDTARKIPNARVLNLFAHTGGASLAARAAGAEVTHCDSIKSVVGWANTNMQLSNMTDIRWIVDDAFKFVKREARRGNRYHGILLDPPAFGHGPSGEKWQLEDQINGLLQELSQLLEPKENFFILNAYSLGYSTLIIRNLVASHFGADVAGRSECGELYLEDRSSRQLPTGIFVRFRTLPE